MLSQPSTVVYSSWQTKMISILFTDPYNAASVNSPFKSRVWLYIMGTTSTARNMYCTCYFRWGNGYNEATRCGCNRNQRVAEKLCNIKC